MRIACLLGVLLISTTSASLAAADENDETTDDVTEAPTVAAAPRPAQEPSRWYGWQTLATDGLALGSGIVGASTDTGALGTFALGTYLVGAPIVHLAHDAPGRAFGSLALRAGLPAAGLLAGCQLDQDDGMFGCLGGAALGVVIGMGAAIAIDSAALAWTDAKTTPVDAHPKGLALGPTFSVGKGAYGLGLGGVF